MNIELIVASVISAVLGIGVVSKFFGKYLPTAKKYIGVAGDAIDLIREFESALEDEKITEDEITRLKLKAIKLRNDFKS